MNPAGLWLHAESAWESWRSASCYPDACFCEQVRPGIILQPANTISSLAFVAAGIGVVWHQRKHAINKNVSPTLFAKSPFLLWLFSASLILIGVGSAFYHASLTFAGQFADVFGMYLIATFVLFVNVSRARSIGKSVGISAYLALNIILASVLYAFPSARRYLFALVLLIALAIEPSFRHKNKHPNHRKHLTIALISIIAGFGIWILDLTKTLCSPASLLQGHAAWHVLGAFATWELYKFYEPIESNA